MGALSSFWPTCFGNGGVWGFMTVLDFVYEEVKRHGYCLCFRFICVFWITVPFHSVFEYGVVGSKSFDDAS